MTDKQRLNALLRLRLFCSTERELSQLVGKQLKGNHFNRCKPFEAEALFSRFSEECNQICHGDYDLKNLLYQYESTSAFFQTYIAQTQHERNKTFLPILLDYVFTGKMPNLTVHAKYAKLCERYTYKNVDNNLSPGILFLLTHRLLPTFNNKSAQDVKDVVADFQAAHDLLLDYIRKHQEKTLSSYIHPLFLQEIQDLIHDEKRESGYLNRLLLIAFTQTSLACIYAMLKPNLFQQQLQKLKKPKMTLPRWWHDVTAAENEVWEMVPSPGFEGYVAYRYRVDFPHHKLHIARYQLIFQDLGFKELYGVTLMRPKYTYHLLSDKQITTEDLAYDYCGLHIVRDACDEIKFNKNSPKGKGEMTLKAITEQTQTDYYTRLVDDTPTDYEIVDDYDSYYVDFRKLYTLSSEHALFFKTDIGWFRLDKFDAEGNETIEGISTLTHDNNILYAILNDEGCERHFLCLDRIPNYIDIKALVKTDFFHAVSSLDEL